MPGSLLDVTFPHEADPLEVRAEIVEGIAIIHDDEDIVVVDKPVGVAVHPSMGWTGPTVVGHLRGAGYRIATSGAPERRGIVQRLDVGTSGVMVIAKSETAYSRLKNAFRHREVDKTYHALVQGHPDPLEGTIDAPIGRHTKSDWKFAVHEDGKHSVTHYSTLEAHRFASLLEVHLETGRTHQIRVHMAALKHPCVGDLTYGADPTLARRVGLERQWLHAVRLGFEHPGSRGVRRVRVDLPRRTWRTPSRSSAMPTDAEPRRPTRSSSGSRSRRTCRPCTTCSSPRAPSPGHPPETRTPERGARLGRLACSTDPGELWLACRDDAGARASCCCAAPG